MRVGGEIGGAGLVVCLGVSLVLNGGLVGGAVALFGADAAGAAEERRRVALVEREPTALGNPSLKVRTRAWIGRREETGRVPFVREVDQAEQRRASLAAVRDRGGRLAGVVAAAAERMERRVETGVERALGLRSVLGEVVRRADEAAARQAAVGAERERREAERERDAVAAREGAGGVAETDAEGDQRASGGSDGEGGADDREAVAVSSVEVEREELGHPLEAGGGLRLRTVRPRFSTLERVRGRGKDPVVRLHFDSVGRVERVEWMQRTGRAAQDEDVESALYRWTAHEIEPHENMERGASALPAVIELRIRL